ncbi:shikimate kinase, partial [Pirellulales bacterium]|nr:shikimate kinase [Pirellulales bacterium]
MGRPIALIGYRGVGKSAVAQQLALHLGIDWIDADVEVELRAGKSIASIFEDEGERAFRELEATVLAELCLRTDVVIACGGGAVLRSDNRTALEACEPTVWLQASVDAIQRRIGQDPVSTTQRPKLSSTGGRTEIEQLLVERTPLYQQCATLEVDTEGKHPA